MTLSPILSKIMRVIQRGPTSSALNVKNSEACVKGPIKEELGAYLIESFFVSLFNGIYFSDI